MQRKYSVGEIDKMRYCLGQMGLGGEDTLRTYMLNGTDPEELVEPAISVLESRLPLGGVSSAEKARRIAELRSLFMRRLCALESA